MADLTYTTLESFKAYPLEEPTGTDEFLLKVLLRAQEDIDALIGRRYTADTYDWYLNPADLTVPEQGNLERATNAQAEHRLVVGEERFLSPGAVIQGPDFTIEGSFQRYSATAIRELRAAGLLLGGARAVP